jgi:hypothetical protein
MTIYEQLQNYLEFEDQNKVTSKYLNEFMCDWNKRNEEVLWFIDNKKDLKDRVRTIAKRHFEDRDDVINTIIGFLEFIGLESSGTESLTYIEIEDLYERNEFDVKLLKYLQQKPRSRGDIAKHFRMTERSLGDHLRSIEDGRNILGSKVKIELIRGTNQYDSTVHPIFLALNLTEVYTLTIALKKYIRSSPLNDTAGDIAEDVYRQLSTYAKDIIDARAKDVDVSFNKSHGVYRNEYDEIKKRKDYHKAYKLKSRHRCKFYYDNEKEPYEGILLGTENDSIVKFVGDDEKEKLLHWDKIVLIE